MKTTVILKLLALTLILTVPVLTAQAQGISENELIIYYSFDEDSLEEGDILDKSENGNDGVIRGDLKIVEEGKVNGCMEFPGGAANFISVRNHHYADVFPEITLAAWVKTAQRGMIASWDRSEFFRFAVGDDVGGNAATTFVGFDVCCPIKDWWGKTDVADDEWHHVVATFDDEMKRIYVDGELDAEAPTDTGNKMIGKAVTRYGFIGIGSEATAFDANRGPTWAFKGLMDEFLMFHRVLSAEEVTHLANASGDPFTSVEPADKLSVTWGRIKSTK
ncbi:MAG: LamG domain-containing protein [Candidatus Poribacteria bacterium]|nr:LamG domain-containing protein [Candidatus Poribacteria bacterium]